MRSHSNKKFYNAVNKNRAISPTHSWVFLVIWPQMTPRISVDSTHLEKISTVLQINFKDLPLQRKARWKKVEKRTSFPLTKRDPSAKKIHAPPWKDNNLRLWSPLHHSRVPCKCLVRVLQAKIWDYVLMRTRLALSAGLEEQIYSIRFLSVQMKKKAWSSQRALKLLRMNQLWLETSWKRENYRPTTLSFSELQKIQRKSQNLKSSKS